VQFILNGISACYESLANRQTMEGRIGRILTKKNFSNRKFRGVYGCSFAIRS
jgi:hypothetical protein